LREVDGMRIQPGSNKSTRRDDDGTTLKLADYLIKDSPLFKDEIDQPHFIMQTDSERQQIE